MKFHLFFTNTLYSFQKKLHLHTSTEKELMRGDENQQSESKKSDLFKVSYALIMVFLQVLF